MSKLGRYSAQRRKIKVLDKATETIKVSSCGTIFMLSRAGGLTATLPLASEAGEGWWCEFIVAVDAGANDYNINTADPGSGSEDNIVGLGFHNNIKVTTTEANATETVTVAGDISSAGDQIAFDGSKGMIVGERCQLLTDGTTWYALTFGREIDTVIFD